jgi:adenine/guanine phosphoribosyltransferase-like PRPP-binding protein
MEPHEFWQKIYPPSTFAPGPIDAGLFAATLPDGRQLALPIRPLPDGERALASLIISQASFAVQAALAEALAGRLAPYGPEIVVGLPTLGLTLASAVAQHLGHARYVPCGTSRKFWYEDKLSAPMSSVTTSAERRLYLDPRMLPLLWGRRVALIDDVISTGTSITAGLALLAACEVEPVVVGAAMLQSDRWRERKSEVLEGWQERVVGVFETPLLGRQGDGWQARK